MTLLNTYINTLLEAIQKGIVGKDSPNVPEYIRAVADIMTELFGGNEYIKQWVYEEFENAMREL